MASIYKKIKYKLCYSLKSNTEKYKRRDAIRSCFCLYPFDLCRFSADFVVCVNMVPEYGEPSLSVEFRSLLENQLNKEFHTKRQDKKRIRKPADFTRSPRLRVLRRKSGKGEFRFSEENEHFSASQ